MKSWIGAEEEFEAAFVGKQHYCFKFHDARQAMGAGGSRRIFTTSHPSDYLVTSQGVTFYAEVKESEDAVSFAFGGIRKSQWSAAIQTIAAGGQYLFFIKSKATGVWYRVPAQVLIAVQKIKQSIKWVELVGMEWKK